MSNAVGKTVLVTGGAGFIGSHTCQALLRSGFDVTCVDNFCDFYDPGIKKENVREIEETAKAENRRFRLFQIDIRDCSLLSEAFDYERPYAVIHLAACAGVRPSIDNPALYTEVNVNGSLNVLECMKSRLIKKLLFASSSSVYGCSEKVPFSEEDIVDRPISPYAATKRAGELFCHTYHHLYGINAACLRLFTVYGPRQRPDLAVYKFTKLILDGKKLPFFGDGSSKRDYTYIDDIVDGIMKALEWVGGSGKRYGIFNLGQSNTVSLSQMLETIERSLGKKAVLDRRGNQPGDVPITCADITHSREVLGYDPKTDFETGYRSFLEWFREKL
jgi:UDP-glucuronate 4-epimerase